MSEIERFADKKAKKAFIEEYRQDCKSLDKREQAMNACGCKSCVALYSNLLRTLAEKWRIPDEEVEIVRADIERWWRRVGDGSEWWHDI